VSAHATNTGTADDRARRGSPDGARRGSPDPAAQRLNERGITLFQAGLREGALVAFRDAAAADNTYAEPWNNQGLILHGLGRLAEALAHLDRALVIRPAYPEALTNRGRVRQALGDIAGARADFDEAIASTPPGAGAAALMHNRGMLRLQLGNQSGALADFDRALALDPTHVPTYLARGTARKDSGDLSGALADYNQALEHSPPERRAAAYHGRGGVRVLQNDFASALADYEQALALEPENFLFHISRGNARYHLRDFRSMRDYRNAFALDADGACREFARLLTADARRDSAGVLDNCTKHLRINSRDVLAHARRGLSLVILGREAEAEPDLASFCEWAPDMPAYLHRVIELIRGPAKELKASRDN
jgi:tetratricopeptide (TPR) repeat protein